MDRVEPYGDDREDMRLAWCMAQLIASNRPEAPSASTIDTWVYELSHYLKCKRPIEDDDE